MNRKITDLFWNASLEELKNGFAYLESEETYCCLVCSKKTKNGVIYPYGDAFADARLTMKQHVEQEHGGMFAYLLSLNKKFTGLTELQSQLLRYMYDGLNDKEITQEMGGGSSSTIRAHRFTLREKEKQAKIMLTIMQLLQEHRLQEPDHLEEEFVTIPQTATMIDERYQITNKEYTEVLNKYFPEGPDGKMTEFPKKEKRKIALLMHLIERFEKGRTYTEKEVNEILKTAFSDYVTLRRYLIEYGFMDRADDGSWYTRT
ncbi:DUF2087 domain-containing protein [Marinicrinis lubricantis]|uniref:DUF2087 domain-containing protein n=1 Tax=Marinicrinis lubricantis TaxID=2086470 RepID=A0ABW1IR14_9BACL